MLSAIHPFSIHRGLLGPLQPSQSCHPGSEWDQSPPRPSRLDWVLNDIEYSKGDWSRVYTQPGAPLTVLSHHQQTVPMSPCLLKSICINHYDVIVNWWKQHLRLRVDAWRLFLSVWTEPSQRSMSSGCVPFITIAAIPFQIDRSTQCT